MKHRIAQRSLSRPTQHRMLMLRGQVTALLREEQIVTTVAKAKETQKLAEKVITWAKKGGRQHSESARRFLMDWKALQPKLFQDLAERYASRPGGYTRLSRYGFRIGDHAPRAILQLVDSPRDLRVGLAAHALGRTLAKHTLSPGSAAAAIAREWRSSAPIDFAELEAQVGPLLSPQLRTALEKALDSPASSSSTRSDALETFNELAQGAFDRMLGQAASGRLRPDEDKVEMLREAQKMAKPNRTTFATLPTVGRKVKAGEDWVWPAWQEGSDPLMRRRKTGTALGRAKGMQSSLRRMRVAPARTIARA